MLAVAVLTVAVIVYVAAVRISKGLKEVAAAVNGMWQSTSEQPTFIDMDEVLAQHSLDKPVSELVLETELLAEELVPYDA